MDDETLFKRFIAGTLYSFPHTYHVRVAYLLSRRYAAEELDEMVLRTFRLLAPSLGLSPASIHVTITIAWTRIIAGLNGQGTSIEFIAEHSKLNNRNLLYDYYTPQRLYSTEAHNRFLMPDKQPFPNKIIAQDKIEN